MTGEKQIPPERDALHAYIGKEAARLLSVYRQQAEKKGGPDALVKKQATMAAALILLYEIGAPPSLVALFDVMLGNVARKEPEYSAEFKWLEFTLNYEARAHNEDRTVTHTEVANAIIDAQGGEGDLDHLIRRVSKIRNADWYPGARDHRRIYLMDNPETV